MIAGVVALAVKVLVPSVAGFEIFFIDSIFFLNLGLEEKFGKINVSIH